LGRPKGSANKIRTPEEQAAADARKAARKAAKASGASVNGKHPPGDNAASLTNDQARALHFIHVGEYEKAQAAVKKASAERKTVIGRIRAEHGDIDQIKDTIALRDPEQEKTLAARISKMVEAARWSGSFIGNLQLDMFAAPDRSPILERAYEEGKTAGLVGRTASTDLAGDAEQEFLRGWHDGQDALKATLELFRSPKKAAEGDPDSAGGEIHGEDHGAADLDEADSVAPWLRDDSESLASNENLAELVNEDDLTDPPYLSEGVPEDLRRDE